jgi:hypothetical protein
LDMPGRAEEEAAAPRTFRGGAEKRRGGWTELALFTRDVSRDIFIAALLVYLVLVVLERLERGFASYFFELNILLVVVVATGGLAILSGAMSARRGAAESGRLSGRMMTAGAAALGAAGAALIYIATTADGWTALVSSLAGGCAVGVLAWLLVRDRPVNGRKGSDSERA